MWSVFCCVYFAAFTSSKGSHELMFTTLLDPEGKVFEQYRA